MRKRILLIESRFNSYYGAQKSMVKLIKVLLLNYEVKVLTTKDGVLSKQLKNENIEVDIVDLGNVANSFGKRFPDFSLVNKIKFILQILTFNKKLMNYIKQNKIDLVYVNNLRTLIYSILAIKLSMKKVVIYIRQDIRDNFINRLVLYFSNYIITIAHGVLDDFTPKWVQRNQKKIYNVYTGFNFPKHLKSIEGSMKGNIKIGFVGSFTERKGLDLLIEAYKDLFRIYPNLSLVLAGKKEKGFEQYWSEIEGVIRDYNLDIEVLGYITDMEEFYNSIDFLVLPSRSEGLPRVVIEAMGYGVPVIASDVGGTREIIINNETGLLVNKDAIGELISSIKLLINSRKLRKKLGNNGRTFVRENFNEIIFEKNVNKVFDLIT